MNLTTKASGSAPTRRAAAARFPPMDAAGDVVECSSQSCRSCSGSLLADCVAVCCCPCAVLNLVALAFFKVPWMIGRRCFGSMKRRKRHGKGRKGKKEGKEREEEGDEKRQGILVKKMEELEFSLEVREEEEEGKERGKESENFSPGDEAERVWMELYQIGHLGFGRVSFTGTH